MGLHVITGGARSGKSAVARDLAETCGRPVVVVVFGQDVDAEMADRIRRHIDDRPVHWVTIEAEDARNWIDRVPTDACLVVDCMGTCVARAMEELAGSRNQSDAAAEHELVPDGFEDDLSQMLAPLIDWLIARGAPTVVVTNEVGDGVVPMWWTARVFRDVLGRVNRRLTDGAQSATLVVCGRCVDLTSLPHRPEVNL